MTIVRSVVAGAILTPLSACALSHVMPPFSATHAYAVATTSGSSGALPARRVLSHGKRITREHDEATDQTRVSVTTHKGAYFLWIQRPRLTFFYVHQGTSLTHTPANVFLVFRTQNPQVPSDNLLIVECDGRRRELAITPIFWLEPGAMTNSRHYMYQLSIVDLADIVACNSTSIAVGDVTAPFASDQLETLRDFAAGMREE